MILQAPRRRLSRPRAHCFRPASQAENQQARAVRSCSFEAQGGDTHLPGEVRCWYEGNATSRRCFWIPVARPLRHNYRPAFGETREPSQQSGILVTRAVIITNPVAGRVSHRSLEGARHRLVAGGLAIEVAHTQGAGDAGRLAEVAVADGVDLVIAHGGDGTVAEVAGALAAKHGRLGILPAGTGNLLAGNLGIPVDADSAARVILKGSLRSLDLGRMETRLGGRHFTVACGAGLDARMMQATPPRLKRTLGRSSYVLTAMRLAAAIVPSEIELQVDGALHRTRAAAVLVANCRYLIPGLLPLRESVRPDDGVLDVAIFEAVSFMDVASQTLALALRRSGSHPGIRVLRGTHIRISATPPMPAEADGDLAGETPLTIDLLPGALNVFVP
jgi:diacylglycerol kinase (ATP)